MDPRCSRALLTGASTALLDIGLIPGACLGGTPPHSVVNHVEKARESVSSSTNATTELAISELIDEPPQQPMTKLRRLGLKG